MTTLPGAILKLIPPGTNDPAIIPVGVVLHQAQSTADSLYGYFNGPSGGIESHLYVRFDGTVEQYRDFEHEADAQAGGNSWLVGGKRMGMISIETEGLASGSWTDAQLTSLTQILHWLSSKYGFPMTKCPTAQPASAAEGGVGWHSEFPLWNPNSHDCPGSLRIAQIPSLLTTEDIIATIDDLKAALADAFAANKVSYGIEAANQSWNRFLIHASDGDVSLQQALGRLLAQAAPAGTTVDLDALAVKLADVLAQRLAG